MNMKQFRRDIHSSAKANANVSCLGGDAFTFELVIGGANEVLRLDSTPLKNKRGYEFGTVGVDKGKIRICISLPKIIRADNIIPYSMADFVMLEVVNNDIDQTLKHALDGTIDDSVDVLSAKAKSIECNITKRVVGKSTPSQVLNMLNRSYYEGTNVVYQRASAICQYDKENETVIIKRPNYYVLKAYDKSLQQLKSGKAHIEAGLLRIEVVMQYRVINKLFNGNSTIRNVLTEQGLLEIIKAYKRIFIDDIIKGHILPCVNDATNILFNTLKETDSQLEAIALHKELIMDEEILRKALERWYKFKGYERARRNTDTYVSRCRTKYGFPRNVLDTLRDFKNHCD